MLLSSAQPRLLPALPWTVVSLPGSHPGLHCLPLGTPTGVGGAKGSVWRASCCSFSETYLRQQVDRNVLPMSVHKGSVPPPGGTWDVGRWASLSGGDTEAARRAGQWSGRGKAAAGCQQAAGEPGAPGPGRQGSALRGQGSCRRFHGSHARAVHPPSAGLAVSDQAALPANLPMTSDPSHGPGVGNSPSEASGLLGGPGPVKGRPPPARLAQNPFSGVMGGSAHTCTHTRVCMCAHRYTHTHAHTRQVHTHRPPH